MTKHPRRPRDFNQAAKLVVDIASGQVEDREPTPEEEPGCGSPWEKRGDYASGTNDS